MVAGRDIVLSWSRRKHDQSGRWTYRRCPDRRTSPMPIQLDASTYDLHDET